MRKEERGPKVRKITVSACGCTVKFDCREPAACAAGVDVLSVLDRHARMILEELTGKIGEEIPDARRPTPDARTGNPETGKEGGAE